MSSKVGEGVRDALIRILGIIILTAALVAFAYVLTNVFGARDEEQTGTCGTCEWEIDDEELTISPAEGEDSGVLKADDFESDSELSVADPAADHWFWSYYGTSTDNAIEDVDVDEGVAVEGSAEELFAGLVDLDEIDVSDLDMSAATDMTCMFEDCSELEEIEGLETFDTSNVTGMDYLFSGCSSLVSLDLSSFDMSNVESTAHMFDGCTALRTVVVGEGFSFDEDCELPAPEDDDYGTGKWRNADGYVYDDPGDIHDDAATTYTAVFEVEEGSGEYVAVDAEGEVVE